MSGEGRQFPPQKQEQQPGVEHEMEPRPRAKKPDYKPSDKLRDRVALITGGDSGIGRAVAHLYALEGASVAITYVPEREEKDAQDTLNMITQCKAAHAKDPIKIPVDLGYDDNCKKVIDQVVQTYGRIDILINNAAVQYEVSKIEDLKPEQLENTFGTNIFSQFYLACITTHEGRKLYYKHHLDQFNAYRGHPSLLDYTATKGAIVAFTRALALHLAKRNIRVNGVAPGPIWTPLIPSSFKPEKVEHFGEECPMGRAGQPDEVATSYVFLASDDATYFTGQVLHPNGGIVVNA